MKTASSKTAGKKLKKLETFLEAENIDSYFCYFLTGEASGTHFLIANGSLERLLTKSLEILYAEDPEKTKRLVEHLESKVKRLEENLTIEEQTLREAQGQIFH